MGSTPDPKNPETGIEGFEHQKLNRYKGTGFDSVLGIGPDKVSTKPEIGNWNLL